MLEIKNKQKNTLQQKLEVPVMLTLRGKTSLGLRISQQKSPNLKSKINKDKKKSNRLWDNCKQYSIAKIPEGEQKEISEAIMTVNFQN